MILIVASILITLMYFLSGIEKANSIDNTAKMLQSQLIKKLSTIKLDFSFYQLCIILVVLLEILGPLLIVGHFINKKKNVLNNQYKKLLKYLTKLSIIFLIIFTILATYLFHYPLEGREYYAFLSNTSVCGGLLLLGNYL